MFLKTKMYKEDKIPCIWSCSEGALKIGTAASNSSSYDPLKEGDGQQEEMTCRASFSMQQVEERASKGLFLASDSLIPRIFPSDTLFWPSASTA